MATYYFRAMPASKSITFDCPACLKTRRKRTFRAECTVNPFNCHPDGTQRSPREVQQQSVADVVRQIAEFERKPLCATCENSLSYKERSDLVDARGAA